MKKNNFLGRSMFYDLIDDAKPLDLDMVIREPIGYPELRPTVENVDFHTVPIQPVETDVFTIPTYRDPIGYQIPTSTPQSTFVPSDSYTARLVDKFGDPVPFATVRSLNVNTIGAVADINGKFSISVPEWHQVEISQVGFNKKVMSASNLTGVITLTMNDANSLDEIVINATPKKETTSNWLLYAGLIAGGLAVFGKSIGLGGGSSSKQCDNRIKCDGLTKGGKLKKGYKFAEGGKVVKVTARSKQRKRKRRSKLRGGITKVSI